MKIRLTLIIWFFYAPAFAQERSSNEELSASANEVISALQAQQNMLLQRISNLASENAKLKAQLEASKVCGDKK